MSISRSALEICFLFFFLFFFFLTGAPAILMVGQVGAGVKESSGKEPGSGSGS